LTADKYKQISQINESVKQLSSSQISSSDLFSATPINKGLGNKTMNQYGFGSHQALSRGSLMALKATKDEQTNESTQEKVQEEKEVTDIEEVDSDASKVVESTNRPNSLYAVFVLVLFTICRIVGQWHNKGFNYTYGYTALGEAAGSPVYEISSAYPQLKNWYGLLAGLFYTLPYSFFGLVVGNQADKSNRKFWLGIYVILASLSMGVSGFVNSFTVLAAMRVLHGMCNSAINPLAFSLVTDYFPPEKRATANSTIQAGHYMGIGLGSFSILLISKFGWRACYGIMAAVGVATGLASMLFVKEPERGRLLDGLTKAKEAKKRAEAEAAAKESEGKNPVKAFFEKVAMVFALPCARNTLIASALRNFGGMAVHSFLPVFFGKVFPAYKAQYAILNALALSVGGLVSSMAGGIIADKFEKKSKMTKALLCFWGTLLSVPLIAGATLQSKSFYLA
jgi:MFS family permease